MAHFARLDTDNKITQVVVISNLECLDQDGKESEEVGVAFCKTLYGADSRWVQTSYSAKIRGKYAGPGDIYDDVNDVFVSPDPVVTEEQPV